MAERGAVDQCGGTSKQNLDRYDIYLGTLLSPKSRYPVEVYTREKGVEPFYLFTPNRKRVIGGGYFGDEEYIGGDTCVRQHMLPGLCRGEDRGTGLGTTLYLAGPMIVKAYGRYTDECTYSWSGDRSSSAEAAWASLNRHDLATQSGAYKGIYIETDADNLISDDEAERLAAEYDDEIVGDIEIESISGIVTIEGHAERNADRIDYDTVAESGLIIHLNPEHLDALERAEIPPKVLAQSDWSQTPLRKIVRIVVQNAQLDAQAGARATEETMAREYVQATAREMKANGWSTIAEALLNELDLGSQRTIPGTERELMKMAANPSPKATQRYAKLAREWNEVYGPGSDWA